MKIAIDFSIFESPTHAYGNVTGEIDINEVPKIDSTIVLKGSKGVISVGGFSGVCKVTSITPVEELNGGIYGLSDVVFYSREIAKDLANRLSDELGLFVVDYNDI